ncbi:protein of unknown function DUF896 [Desulfofarcimen acetoxidans DSM 771]|uniref:UPF0291 protein Dtox_2284 n=1 Tax=Desulfofarcimen acetoxidans (strain ATCC 49208 / DSM 771 / KCTC 5769 / VKM B-1644 / 5575) TaxID=485916 RepID=C8VZX0_DESAS|nr:DUF896 domain-containing protein [Desulfofarcimen acetoxidans]ACV63098.1 protein of unknown function DUF896 [Desulfofarcimen acetoxidans DSM 771]
MMTKELIERINELSRKQRSVGLDAVEKEEQAKLRGIYLQGIREQVIDGLETLKTGQEKHESGCSCGHCHAAQKKTPS